jgi:hypothetical protein
VKRYFAVKNSTVSLASGTLSDIQARMKKAIYLHGPIVAAFNVFGDFVLPASLKDQGWGWKKTNGIYVHTSSDNAYSGDEDFLKFAWENKDASASHDSRAGIVKSQLSGVADYGSDYETFKRSIADYMNQILGAHAVVVVGWGSGDAGKYGKVNYWIVRNSWGEDWNEGGYFRIAFQEPERDINVNCSMEIWSSGGGPQGGCTSFMPDLTSPHLSPALSLLGSSGNGKVSQWFKKNGWIIIIIVLLATIVLIVYLRKKHVPRG